MDSARHQASGSAVLAFKAILIRRYFDAPDYSTYTHNLLWEQAVSRVVSLQYHIQ